MGMSLAGTTRDIRKICSGLLIASASAFLFFGGVSMPLLGVLAMAFVMVITLQDGFS